MVNNFYNNSSIGEDLDIFPISKIDSIIKKKTDVMTHENFCTAMRTRNEKQRKLHLKSFLDYLQNPATDIFTGAAGTYN